MLYSVGHSVCIFSPTRDGPQLTHPKASGPRPAPCQLMKTIWDGETYKMAFSPEEKARLVAYYRDPDIRWLETGTLVANGECLLERRILCSGALPSRRMLPPSRPFCIARRGSGVVAEELIAGSGKCAADSLGTCPNCRYFNECALNVQQIVGCEFGAFLDEFET